MAAFTGLGGSIPVDWVATFTGIRMPKEINFTGGTRGKFFRKNAQLQLPIHLEANVQNTLAASANAKGVDLSTFVNELLKKDIELIQMSR